MSKSVRRKTVFTVACYTLNEATGQHVALINPDEEAFDIQGDEVSMPQRLDINTRISNLVRQPKVYKNDNLFPLWIYGGRHH